ncbi:hypothetical protein [Micromonospora sp. CB01531]|uniref:hypothetical protein n=1 Tax=Micromonospora sp. CB01531 TaxID=1718947 RepID=UPI00093F73C5|nr:hypothetical protein [Micromonospora sp. CB01531]OKI54557.1 hypothetical protein A6A27_32030 [Micromonospora sp. CB01531]
MSYTVADVDRVMEGDFEAPSPSGAYTMTQDDGSLWSLFKYEEVNNVPTELGVISYVADYGGEGQGEQYWVVVKVKAHDGTERYFRRDGWYQSYSGGELDGPTVEVKPTQKTVTVYE